MIKVQVASRSITLRAGLRTLLSSGMDVLFADDIADETWVERVLEPDAIGICLRDDLGWIDGYLGEFKGLLVIGDDPALISKMAEFERLAGWGILPLTSSAEGFRAALEAIGNGLVAVAPHLLISSMPSQPKIPRRIGNSTSDVPPLTSREIEVLGHLAQGLQNKQIGLLLGISENTVKFHISSIYSKLDVVNRADAVRAGVIAGLVAL